MNWKLESPILLLIQATYQDTGGILNLNAYSHPHKATSMNLPQLCFLNLADKISLQLLLNNEATSIRMPQLASIRPFMRYPQENVLNLLGIKLFWFPTQTEWFLKRAWAA